MKFKIQFIILLFIVSPRAYSTWFSSQVERGPLVSPIDTTNGSMYFSGIDCADSINCMAIANYANFYRVIYQSTDAGKNWNIIYKPDYGKTTNKPLLKSISYPKKNKCIIGTDSGFIFLTNDMGVNWKKINTPISDQPIKFPGYITIRNIKMYDSIHGIANTDFFIIYTKDGGNNWNFLSKPDSSCGIVDAVMTSPSNIIFYGTCDVKKNNPFTKTMFISKDTGQTWSAYDYSYIDSSTVSYNGYKGTLKLFFTDSLNGWGVGGDPTGVGDIHTEKITSTRDGGKTWQFQQNRVVIPNLEIWDVSFYNSNIGICVTRGGGILRTSDRGINWIQDSVAFIQQMQSPMNYVCFRNVKNPLIAVSLGGKIYYEEHEVNIYENNVINNDVSIYPNPVSDVLIISLNHELQSPFHEGNYIEIYTTLGLKVIESLWQEKIDVSGLYPGIYFVKIGNRIGKFIKI